MSQDCNANSIPDECEIVEDFTLDIDLDGQLDECVAPALMANTYELSLANGGTQAFSLQTPPSINPVDFYILVGSLAGTSPGTSFGTFTLPLNPDVYFYRTLSTSVSKFLTPGSGVLAPSASGGGQATATFSTPPISAPALVGKTVHHAFLTIGLQTGTVNFVSNAVPLALLP